MSTLDADRTPGAAPAAADHTPAADRTPGAAPADPDHIPGAAPAASFRFAVNVTPKEGILDPQGRAVEQSLPHLGVAGVGRVRVGRRVELTVEAADAAAARAIVDRLAGELLANPLIEQFEVEVLAGASSTSTTPTSGTWTAGGSGRR
jgi:phosphoribosylformylglycinamidine synthase subunit PurS